MRRPSLGMGLAVLAISLASTGVLLRQYGWLMEDSPAATLELPQGTRDFVVAEWRADKNVPTYMIRSGDWKLLISRIPDAESLDALYNLENDPHEMDNLLFDGMPEAHARVAAELKEKLLSWLEEVGSPAVKGVRDRRLPRASSP